MTARTHDLAAITTLLVVVVLAPVQSVTLATAIVAILANLFGGIAPDIDQPTAPFWRNLPIGKYFGRIFDDFMGGHRFLTHSIIGLFIAGVLFRLLLLFVSPITGSVNLGYVWWAFMIGMASHLVMDTLTKEGVPWLLPIPFKFGIPPIRAWRITTGKNFERWIIFPAILVFGAIFSAQHYQQILYILHRQIT